MDDFLELTVGLLICTLPVAAIVALIIFAVRRGVDKQRMLDAELSISRLAQDNAQLVYRVARMEKYLNELEAQRKGWGGGLVPPPVQPSEAAEPQPAVEAPIEAAAPMEATTSVPEPVAPPPTEEVAAPEPTPAPVVVAPPPPPRAPAPAPIAWERWIGVRGAAALGASILVLSAIYFFEYSIEHGFIPAWMRMIAGTIVGLGCVVGSEVGLRKSYRVLASWVGGAGIAILYVAFWAGLKIFELYPTWAGAILMIAVTAACVALAWRRDAPPIAVLGLLGGFITPLALSRGHDQPIPLFSYILLLDGAMLWLAYKRRWPWMALLCLVCTALYQHAWLLTSLDQRWELIVAVIVVAVFAILFAALPSAKKEDEDESPIWKWTRSAGVVLPLLFTIPFAARSGLGEMFWPTAIQLVLLCTAACWVGRRHESAILPSGAALLSIGALIGWALGQEIDRALEIWELVGLATALAIVFHVFGEIDRTRGSIASSVFTLSVLVIAVFAAPVADAAGLWPWLAAWIALGALGLRLASFPDRRLIALAVSALVALGLGITYAARVGDPGYPNGSFFLGILVACAMAMQLPSFIRKDAIDEHAAVLFALALIALSSLAIEDRAVPAWSFYGATLLSALLGLFAATRAARRPQPQPLFASLWMLALLLGSALAHGIWVARRYEGPFSPLELAPLGVAVLLFASWPIVAPRAMRDQPWSWRTAALAGPLYLLAMRHVYLDAIGPSSIGLLPIALAAISIGGAYMVRARGPHAEEARRVAMVWLTATGAGFVTLAIPLQLSEEWITIGWALEALVLTALWRRLDHAGVKYLALGLAAAVTIRLVVNPAVLEYHERTIPILNWIAYTYLVPAAALAGIWWLMRDREVARRRPWEKPFFPEQHPLLAHLAAAAALLVLFVWINLAIYDFFGSGRELTIALERQPARDLTQSVAWALYALALLGLGLARKSKALRFASLGLIVITCGKAFLYDVAHLENLYRVVALAVLAIVLLVISFAYHRFVFRPSEEAR